jgi:hypothetical protein
MTGLFKPSRRGLITGAAALAAYGSLARAGINHGVAAAGGAADSAWTWDQTSGPTGYFTFSPDGLTATRTTTNDNSWGTLKMTASFTTGKRLCEFLMGPIFNNTYVGITVADGSGGVGGNNTFLGNDGHAVGFSNGGVVNASGGINFTDFGPPFYIQGNTCMVADDATNGFTYARSSAQSNWIGQASVADDPSTPTGGLIEASSFFSANVARFFAASMKNSGDYITINQTFTQTKPTGYTG